MKKYQFYLIQQRFLDSDNPQWEYMVENIRLNDLESLAELHSKRDNNEIDDILRMDLWHHGKKIRDLRWKKVEIVVK